VGPAQGWIFALALIVTFMPAAGARGGTPVERANSPDVQAPGMEDGHDSFVLLLTHESDIGHAQRIIDNDHEAASDALPLAQIASGADADAVTIPLPAALPAGMLTLGIMLLIRRCRRAN
jgi:hypothetical protein